MITKEEIKKRVLFLHDNMKTDITTVFDGIQITITHEMINRWIDIVDRGNPEDLIYAMNIGNHLYKILFPPILDDSPIGLINQIEKIVTDRIIYHDPSTIISILDKLKKQLK